MTKVSVTTGLTDLPSLIADRRHSHFGHVCRLSRDTPVSQALHLSIDAFTGTPPAADWKRPPQRTWLQQVEEDNGSISISATVPVNSQAWTADYGDCYDPQLIKRSSV